MFRKLVGAALVVTVCVGLAAAEEFGFTLKKVDGDKISGVKGGKFNKETKKLEGGEDVTLTVTADVKVIKSKFNKETKKLEPGDAVEGGLKGIKIGDNGTRVQIVTGDDGKVKEVRVLGGKGKGKGTE